MDDRLFRRFCEIAYDRAGLCIKEGKESLVSARISKRIRVLDLDSEKSYLEYLEADDTGEELVSFLDAISTNYTRFFREPDHFDGLEAAVGRWVAAGQKKLKIWSAASSTGEEPYSIAITLLEKFPGVEFTVLATDISTRVLAKAQRGEYDAGVTDTVPRGLLDKYFEKRFDEDESAFVYAINDSVKSRVFFRRLNLSTPPYPMKGPLDVVFCRNVMIYFDTEVRQRVTTEVDRLLRPGGMFAIGHSETLTGVHSSLVRVASSVFTKPLPGAPLAPNGSRRPPPDWSVPPSRDGAR